MVRLRFSNNHIKLLKKDTTQIYKTAMEKKKAIDEYRLWQVVVVTNNK